MHRSGPRRRSRAPRRCRRAMARRRRGSTLAGRASEEALRKYRWSRPWVQFRIIRSQNWRFRCNFDLWAVSSLRVAPLCLGGNVFGWTANETASFAVLDALLDAGLNFIDTADVYSAWAPGHRGGESETVIGRWLRRGASATMSSSRPKSACPWHPIAKACPQGTSCTRSKTRCDDCRPTTSICTFRIATIPRCPWRRRSAPIETDLPGQGARDRRLELHGPREWAAALEVSRKHGLPRYEVLQPDYNLDSRAGL